MKEILKALAKFHSKIDCIPKTEENPYHHSNYSALDTVYNHIKKALLEAGLWFYHKSSIIENDEGKRGIEVRTVLYHIETGQEMDITPVQLFPKDQDNPQAWGSCITYAKRYSLQLAIGLPSEEEDDDANAGAGLKKPEKTYKIEKDKEKQEEKPANIEKSIPYWMEMEIKKINDLEDLERFYKENEKSARKYGNINSLIEECRKRKEEILKTMQNLSNMPKEEKPKRKKLDIPEESISKTTRSEMIALLKYYIQKIYGSEVNPLDLFMDEDGNVPGSLDKISDAEIEKMIERLKKAEQEDA